MKKCSKCHTSDYPDTAISCMSCGHSPLTQYRKRNIGLHHSDFVLLGAHVPEIKSTATTPAVILLPLCALLLLGLIILPYLPTCDTTSASSHITPIPYSSVKQVFPSPTAMPVLTPSPTAMPVPTPSPTTSLEPTATPTLTPCTPLLNALQFSFTGIQGQPDPPSQSIEIWNPCENTENWSIPSSLTSWLSTSVISGTLSAGETRFISIIAQTGILAIGPYEESIPFVVGGSLQTINVMFTVEPEFQVSVNSFDVTQSISNCTLITLPPPSPLPYSGGSGSFARSPDEYWLCTEILTLTQGANPISWSGVINGSSITFGTSSDLHASTSGTLSWGNPVPVIFRIDQSCHKSNNITFTDASNPAISINIPITCWPDPVGLR